MRIGFNGLQFWITVPRTGGRWDMFFGVPLNEFGLGLVTRMEEGSKGFDAYLFPLRLSVMYTSTEFYVDKDYFI